MKLRRRYGRAKRKAKTVEPVKRSAWTEWASTPRGTVKIVLRFRKEPYSSTGVAWNAFEPDGTPLYIGAETLDALKRSVAELYPNAAIEVER